MSPGTVPWATLLHPTHCMEKQLLGKGWRNLEAVTRVNPIISHTQMLSPCRVLPESQPCPDKQSGLAAITQLCLFPGSLLEGRRRQGGDGAD